MPERGFDKRMEDWIAAEVRAAPALRPTEEMVRLVEAKRQPADAPRLLPRWAAAGVVFAALALLIISGLFLAGPTSWSGPSPAQQIAFVEQRSGPDAPLAPPDGGKGGGEEVFSLLALQIHRAAAGSVVSLDTRIPLPKPITLTAQDDYRLAIQPAQTCMLYVLQVSPDGEYLALHPESGFNPVVAGQTVFLPASPDWFYLSGESGAYRLVMVAAPSPLPELTALYDQYLGAATGRDRESAREALDEVLESIRTAGIGGVDVWELMLDHQD